MFPHERALVKRLEGKPFALIGVNSDEDRDDVKKKNELEHITWRSFWNGGSTGGPISTKWNIQGWPTIYVVDMKGVIRHKGVRGPAMDKAVNALLKEGGIEFEDKLSGEEKLPEKKPAENKDAEKKPAEKNEDKK